MEKLDITMPVPIRSLNQQPKFFWQFNFKSSGWVFKRLQDTPFIEYSSFNTACYCYHTQPPS